MVVDLVRQDEDFRMVSQARFLAHVVFERAETLGKGNLLRRGQFLARENHDLVVEKRFVDLGEAVVVQRF